MATSHGAALTVVVLALMTFLVTFDPGAPQVTDKQENSTEAGGGSAVFKGEQLPPYIVSPSRADVLAKRGFDVRLPCEAFGAPLPEIAWIRGSSQPLSPGYSWQYELLLSGTLVVHKVSSSDAGPYRCVVYNDAGNRTAELNLVVVEDFPDYGGPAPTPSESPSLRLLVVIGIPVGGLLLGVVLLVILVFFCRRRPRRIARGSYMTDSELKSRPPPFIPSWPPSARPGSYLPVLPSTPLPRPPSHVVLPQIASTSFSVQAHKSDSSEPEHVYEEVGVYQNYQGFK